MNLFEEQKKVKKEAFSVGYNYAKQQIADKAKKTYLDLSILKTKLRRKGADDEADTLEAIMETI